MLRTKVPRSSKLTLLKDGMEEQLQNICRYYVRIYKWWFIDQDHASIG